jgi:hypothetical protein
MALQLPQIDDVGTRVERIGQDGDSTTYRVTVTWTNSGRLPTALRQAQLVKIVQEDRGRLEFDPGLMESPNEKVRIVVPSRRDKILAAGWTQPGETRSVTFEVQTYGLPGLEGTAHVMSTRGGLVKVPLVIGTPPESN